MKELKGRVTTVIKTHGKDQVYCDRECQFGQASYCMLYPRQPIKMGRQGWVRTRGCRRDFKKEYEPPVEILPGMRKAATVAV